jgi:hypothetical protein
VAFHETGVERHSPIAVECRPASGIEIGFGFHESDGGYYSFVGAVRKGPRASLQRFADGSQVRTPITIARLRAGSAVHDEHRSGSGDAAPAVTTTVFPRLRHHEPALHPKRGIEAPDAAAGWLVPGTPQFVNEATARPGFGAQACDMRAVRLAIEQGHTPSPQLQE